MRKIRGICLVGIIISFSFTKSFAADAGFEDVDNIFAEGYAHGGIQEVESRSRECYKVAKNSRKFDDVRYCASIDAQAIIVLSELPINKRRLLTRDYFKMESVVFRYKKALGEIGFNKKAQAVNASELSNFIKNGVENNKKEPTIPVQEDKVQFEQNPILEDKTYTPAKDVERLTEDTYVRSKKVSLYDGAVDFQIGCMYYENDLSSEDKTRIFELPITVTYGLTENLTGYISVPFSASWNETSGTNRTETHSNYGIGDVRFGASHQILHEAKDSLDLMVGLDIKTNSGKSSPANADNLSLSGEHWAFTVHTDYVKNYDPVVFSGGLSYTHALKKNINGKETTPGDSLGAEFGVGIIFNEEVFVNYKMAGAYNYRTKEDGARIGGITTPVQFTVALTKLLTKKDLIEPSISIGLTEGAPNAVVGLSYLKRFK